MRVKPKTSEQQLQQFATIAKKTTIAIRRETRDIFKNLVFEKQKLNHSKLNGKATLSSCKHKRI